MRVIIIKRVNNILIVNYLEYRYIINIQYIIPKENSLVPSWIKQIFNCRFFVLVTFDCNFTVLMMPLRQVLYHVGYNLQMQQYSINIALQVPWLTYNVCCCCCCSLCPQKQIFELFISMFSVAYFSCTSAVFWIDGWYCSNYTSYMREMKPEHGESSNPSKWARKNSYLP
jgi:hypothetical protein